MVGEASTAPVGPSAALTAATPTPPSIPAPTVPAGTARQVWVAHYADTLRVFTDS